jgi:TDG/mug DNA glycosylase family protein
MTGIHFAHPSNRFWPALNKAGLIDWMPNLAPVAPSVKIEIHEQPSSAPEQTHIYPALRRAGLIDFDIDTDQGMTDRQRAAFTAAGMGISNLVQRATIRASELTADELRAGGERLCGLVAELRPAVVAVAGVTAYRTAFDARSAVIGRQDVEGDVEWWVLPNPSGLNAHVQIDDLAGWFRTVADRAGLS